jgi:hypothetical protein
MSKVQIIKNISTVDPLHVLVQFGDEIPSEHQGPALLAFEKALRKSTGLDVRVFKDRMGDDSKLRVRMTKEQRDNL